MNPDESQHQGTALQCGWGRLIFAQTYPSSQAVAEALLEEKEGQRDIAFYVKDPHVILSYAPQELFLDPSHTFRLEFRDYGPNATAPDWFEVGSVKGRTEIDEANRIYATLGMVMVDGDLAWRQQQKRTLSYVVARSASTGKVLGVANGVDHWEAFGDPDNGCSLWALAVDPQAEFPRVGDAITRYLIESYRERGRERMDISVLHTNRKAIRFYEKLGFRRISVFAIKKRNPINESLYVDSPPQKAYNPYARIIIEEALRRGVSVDPIDPKRGYFVLSLGGRSITCRESLSELTTAIAMSRCDDKQLTRELLDAEGLQVPAQQESEGPEPDRAFLERWGRLVVKPLRGEQGRGVTVDVRTPDELEWAVEVARRESDSVLLEPYFEGEDLRVIVINYEVVAAAVRRPAEIVGTGDHTIEELIQGLSRRRASATQGESSIPMDEETTRCVRGAGYQLDSVLPQGEALRVRKTANLHTGGTIHDVTGSLHPGLADAAIRAATVLEIPVVGLDFIVGDPQEADYVIIEANERPGLANHEPRPTAERFVDLLFPHTARGRMMSH